MRIGDSWHDLSEVSSSGKMVNPFFWNFYRVIWVYFLAIYLTRAKYAELLIKLNAVQKRDSLYWLKPVHYQPIQALNNLL